MRPRRDVNYVIISTLSATHSVSASNGWHFTNEEDVDCVASGTCACMPWRPTPFARPIRVNDHHGHQTQVPRTEKAHAEVSNNAMWRRKRLSGCNPEECQTLSNLQKISCIILRNLFGLYLISHVPPAHSFFEKRFILDNFLLIWSNVLFSCS